MKKEAVSVVVPAFNEEDYIVACIEALRNELAPDDEIIVVDNNSADSTPEKVKAIAKHDPRVRYLLETKQGSMAARKAGFDLASNALLATIDSDTQVKIGWSSEMSSELIDSNADGISGFGTFRVKYLKNFTSTVANLILFRAVPLFLGTKGFLFGTSYMIKREAWEEIGTKVDTSKEVWDDYEVTLLVNDAGYKIKNTTTSLYTYSTRRSLDSPVKLLSYGNRGLETLKRHRGIRAYLLPLLGLLTVGMALLVLRPVNMAESVLKQD